MKKIILYLMSGFAASGLGAQTAGVSVADFGKTKNGEPVKLFTLKNANGITVKITDYGAVVCSVYAPDRRGKFADVVLGFDSIAEYETLSDYFGAVVGRYGNRIARGEFSIDGRHYKLDKNNGENTLHGGFKGFDKKVWSARIIPDKNAAKIKLSLLSPDGEGGFPGNLKVDVVYTLDNENALTVEYRAETDKPTVCNLTQHSYFNLFGAGNGSILNHELTIDADSYTPVDKDLIPLGDAKPVADTPFDFRKPMPVGSRINADSSQLRHAGGYDHNWVLNKKPGEMKLAAVLYEPVSGRMLEVSTTEPGIQFYSGNFLAGQKGKGGKAYKFRYGMCLETQHFPDSPNRKEFPSTLLRPGETYNTKTVFKFLTQ